MSEKYGKDMHYPEFHVSRKTLKRWSAAAKTPEEKAQYAQHIPRPHGNLRHTIKSAKRS